MPVYEELPTIVVKGREWDMSSAPKFVQHAIRLLIEKWDRDFDDRTKVQPAVAHRARLLAEKYGVPHP